MKNRSTRESGPHVAADSDRRQAAHSAAIASDFTTSYLDKWSSSHSYLLMTALVLVCLLPFSGRAFHVDDTLFLWAARQIADHPHDPYGFQLTWDTSRVPMSDVTQNPPLASYYIALVGKAAGWSERALHLGFVVVALALVLGTYRLAAKFTRCPVVAACCTLLAPGILVSASSVMCDTMMLAFWVGAAIFWIEGMQSNRMLKLVFSGILITTAALTKYYGAALIPLLCAYSFARYRRLAHLLYLLIPVAALCAYQLWTKRLYGHGLLLGAAQFAAVQRASTKGSLAAMTITALSFTGGCSLFGWTLSPFVWPRKTFLIGIAAGGIASLAMVGGWLNQGLQLGGDSARRPHLLIGIQLAFCIAGGVSVVGCAVGDFWKRRDSDSLFLALWVVGTFFFAAFLNYTVNARSLLPLIPATGILLARRLDEVDLRRNLATAGNVALIVLLSGAFSFWIADADAKLANSARTAARVVVEKTRRQAGTVWFEGHWGFQYYMESLGAHPLDLADPQAKPGDFVVIPDNNIQLHGIPREFVGAEENFELPLDAWVTTISWELGAGFYSSYWGPLPYALGPVSPERYSIIRIKTADPHTP